MKPTTKTLMIASMMAAISMGGLTLGSQAASAHSGHYQQHRAHDDDRNHGRKYNKKHKRKHAQARKHRKYVHDRHHRRADKYFRQGHRCNHKSHYRPNKRYGSFGRMAYRSPEFFIMPDGVRVYVGRDLAHHYPVKHKHYKRAHRY